MDALSPYLALIRERSIVVASVGVPVLLYLLLALFTAIDHAGDGGTVRRNVTVAGRDVGGLDRDGLRAALAGLDDVVRTKPIELVTEGATVRSDGAALGLSVDGERTVDGVLAQRRGGFVLFAPFRWLGSFLGEHEAPLHLIVDEATATATVAQLDTEVRVAPVEPDLADRSGKLTVVEGRPGAGLDPADVLPLLETLEGFDGDVVAVEVPLAPVQPTFTAGDAERLRQIAETTLARGVTANVPEVATQRTLTADDLRPHVRAVVRDGGLHLGFDQAGLDKVLETVFAGLGAPPRERSLTVVDGKVVPAPGSAGRMCCAPTSGPTIADALETGRGTAELAMKDRPAVTDQAYIDRMGLKERVGAFTTEFPCCPPRVTNIQRMADMVTGSVIEPGESFSINDTVGQRTSAKGFVAAPMIDGAGNFVDDVGGGVSQFATTLFNAAFFAGLEIDEYMAHGLYISRYPYGREATLSFPGPDLVVRNQTPHGVLIVARYTDTSVTVELWSTATIKGEQTAQFTSVYGAVCTYVTTVRTRTVLATGATSTDRYYALYAPGEGVQCDGSIILKPGVTTTTAPPPPTSAGPPSSAPPTSSSSP